MEGSAESAAITMDALSSSTSLKTLERSMIESDESSIVVMFGIGCATTGGSSTALTVTVKLSLTLFPLEVPVTVILAVPDLFDR